MSAALISVFILVSSLALLGLWFRQACRAILQSPKKKEFSPAVASVVRPGTMPDSAEARGADPLWVGLEHDYRALTYLLGKTSKGPAARACYNHALLRLDFHLLRFAMRARYLLGADYWRAGLEEMAGVLTYFANVVGERLQVSLNLLEPCWAAAGDRSAPALAMCSYCKQVAFPTGDHAGKWMGAQRYLALGGQRAVALTHGVCPDCLDHLVRRAA